MRGDLLRSRIGEAVPQVPAVADLHRVWQRRADGLPVGTRPVTGDDFHAGMGTQPFLHDIGGAPFQDVDPPAGLGVDEDRRVGRALPQGEVVNPEYSRHRQRGKGDLQQRAQQGVTGGEHAQRGQQPGPGAPS
jgi:hypothetical protein